jgi:hypothetical protein
VASRQYVMPADLLRHDDADDHDAHHTDGRQGADRQLYRRQPRRVLPADARGNLMTGRGVLSAVAAAALAATLSACGTVHAAPSTPPLATAAAAAAQTPANPMPILKKTGAVAPAGTVYGLTDVYGDRYASGGAAPDNCGGPCEQISVHTYADAAAHRGPRCRAEGDDGRGCRHTAPDRLRVAQPVADRRPGRTVTARRWLA